MTDSPILDPPGPVVDWRGRLQRRLRHDRRYAVRQTWVVLAITAAMLVAGTSSARSDVAPVDPALVSTIDPADERWIFTATMVGDVMLGRNVEAVIDQWGGSLLYEEVQPLLTGDYVSANLEQVISDDEDLPLADKLIHLRSSTASARLLEEAGFTTVSLANNHAMDHGIPGLDDTLTTLDALGLRHAGAGRDLDEASTIDYQEVGDLTVATLSFTDVFVNGFVAYAFQGGVLDTDEDRMGPMIVEARANADLVIVHLHFGEEYDNGVSADQVEIAELAALAGADIVVGAHPHVILPSTVIDDTLVFYSLGNFIFDQGWTRTRESVIARYALAADGTARVEMIPIIIREATPRVLDGAMDGYHRARIFQRVRQDSAIDWRQEGIALVADLDLGHGLGEAAS